jgi:peptide/nickel transport system substrate-binding protein
VPPGRPAASPSARPATEQRSGGTLRLGRLGVITQLDGHTSVAADTVWQLFDRLTAYDDAYTPQPRLAESWDASPDGRTFKLNLRKGVTFQGGRPLSSQDVEWNILRVRDPKVGSGPLAAQSRWFSSFQKADASTLILGADQPRALAFDFFECLNIMDPEATDRSPENQPKVFGTGPFQFADWKPGAEVTLKKNPNYWRSGRPFADELRVTFARDAQSLIAGIESGAVDMVLDPPHVESARLQRRGYQGFSVPNALFVISANARVAPLDDKRVRQAMSYAIDRRRFAETVLLGSNPFLQVPALPGSLAHDAANDRPYPYDLDKADQLLRQAVRRSPDLEILGSARTPEHAILGQILQGDLARLGINLTLKIVEHGTYLSELNEGRFTGLSIGNPTHAGLELASMLTANREFDPAGSPGGFQSDRYRQLTAQASAEPDRIKRKAIYADLMQLLTDESFAMPVSEDRKLLLVRPNVAGIGQSKHGVFPLADVSLA